MRPIPSSKAGIIPLPNQIPVDKRKAAIYLPILQKGMYFVEQATGYKWVPTSYARNSPSHSQFISLDIIPEFSKELASRFSSFKPIPSDPVLPLRLSLLNKLIPLSKIPASRIPWDTRRFSLMVFVESDHLHLQIGAPQKPPISVVKWHQPKPVYRDTLKRGRVKPFSGSYQTSCSR